MRITAKRLAVLQGITERMYYAARGWYVLGDFERAVCKQDEALRVREILQTRSAEMCYHRPQRSRENH